jgi:DNA processing protein
MTGVRRNGSGALGACDRCLRRSWLLGRLAGHLEVARARIGELLGLGEAELIAAVGGRHAKALAGELEAADVSLLRAGAHAAALDLVCRCSPAYPQALLAVADAPPAIYVAGGCDRLQRLLGEKAVAVVGTRRPTPYGLEQARALGHGLAACEVAVVNGLALGIDGAAAIGALELAGGVIAILAGGAGQVSPSSRRPLLRRVLDAGGVALWELPVGSAPRRWMFAARNRLIATLCELAVVVEAPFGSGALLTARLAAALGRAVGAVPGRVGTAQAQGPHQLLADGALLVRGAQDVLDRLFGVGVCTTTGPQRAALDPSLARVLAAIGAGADTPDALARTGIPARRCLAALAALELHGYVRRGPGGRYVTIA